MNKYINRILLILFFLWMQIQILKADVSLTYHEPTQLKGSVEGLFGYICDFSKKGIHSLNPSIHENQAILCKVSSHFIYDRIFVIMPKKESTPGLKISPEGCFKKVYTNYATRQIEDITSDTLGLTESSEESKTVLDNTVLSLTISPFVEKKLTIFCFIDNSGTMDANTKGRMAFVEINIMPYQFKITSINLTSETFAFLKDVKTKDQFDDKKSLELSLTPGELVVLACEKVDKQCFQRKKSKGLYKSNKIIYHKKFSIFKAPMYVNTNELETFCSCEVGSDKYEVMLKPTVVENPPKIPGCDFSGETTSTLTNVMDMTTFNDEKLTPCDIDLTAQSIYNTLIGMVCPGEIEPDCFFQIFEINKPTAENTIITEPQRIAFLDNHLGINGLEFYEDIKETKKIRIFSLVGIVQANRSFACICRKDKKFGIMRVSVSSTTYSSLASIIIIIMAFIYMAL